MIRSKFNTLSPQEAVITPAEQAMAEEFRRGIAMKLGVPIEQISQERAYKWVANWARAFMKPQLWAQQGYVRRLGEDLMNMLAPISPQHLNIETQETRMPPRGSESEQERRTRFSRSEISVQK